MATIRSDLRHAWRALVRRRAYFVASSATLALVLGANAAIFAAMSATILRPMPFAEGARVVQLFMQPPGLTAVSSRNPLQQMDVVRFRERARTMTRLEGYLPAERVVLRDGEPTVVQAAAVTPGLLEMLDARAQAGRTFTAEEESPGHRVAIVTDGYWRRVLGGGAAVGTPLVIDGEPHTIVGVLRRHQPPAWIRAEILTPLAPDATPVGRNPGRSVLTLAQLAPGASVEAASAEARELSRQLAAEFPRTHAGWTAGVQTARQWQYGAIRLPLLILFGATAAVVLIACANLASLAAGQAAARAAELSLRIALGATRADVLRLQAAELLIIAFAGLGPGLGLAALALPPLLSIDPAAARALGPVGIDWRVLAFTSAAAVLTALVAAAVPTVQVLRGRPAAFAEGRRVAGSVESRRLRRVLVGGEVALCLALLMGGAVLVRGLAAISRTDPGFEPSGVLTAQLRLPERSYGTPDARAAFVTRLLQNVRAIPGVTAASTTMNQFVPGFTYQMLFHVEHRPTPDGQPHTTLFRRISPDYFRTMRIPEIAGRTFTDADSAGSPAVAVISRQFAEQLFQGEDPIGRVLRRTPPDAPPITIVGVVGDVRDVSLTQAPEPTLYLAWSQNNNTVVPVSLVVRTEMDPVALVPAVRGAVAAIDPSLPLRNAQPLEAFMGESVAPERFRTTVLGIIAGLGLTLAALGIYAVTYRGVVERTHEFAVRMALGAGRARVVRLMLGDALRDVALGIVAGVGAGLGLTAVLQRLIANAGSGGAATIGAAVAILGAAAVAAALIPALRILRVEPSRALAR